MILHSEVGTQMGVGYYVLSIDTKSIGYSMI